MSQYLILVTLWGGWCFLHSFMITPAVTSFIQKQFSNQYRYYRLFYNLTALVTLIPVAVYSFSLSGEPFFIWAGPYRVFQLLLVVSALWLFVSGAGRYDFKVLMGIRQARDTNKGCSVLTVDCNLDTSGILGVVRHPWYAGGILIVWARDMDTVTFLTSLMITIYLIIGSLLEEKKLVAEFGQVYVDYRRRVSMFFPVKWILRKLGIK